MIFKLISLKVYRSCNILKKPVNILLHLNAENNNNNNSHSLLSTLAFCGPSSHKHPDWQVADMNNRHSITTKTTGNSIRSHLVAPLEHIFLAIFQLVVDVEELDDAVLSYVVSILLALFPVEWRAQWQQTHGESKHRLLQHNLEAAAGCFHWSCPMTVS